MGNILISALENRENIVLLGHLHPDGDAIGSTLGLYNYLKENYPEKKVDLYLDDPAKKFSYLAGFEEIRTEYEEGRTYDLCISLDSSDTERLGVFLPYFETAAHTLCIDHHRTNPGFADENLVVPEASSCSEVLFGLLDGEKISRCTAECIYTGIIHDTGVFKYSSTSRATMDAAGFLMEKGIPFGDIIDGSFYRRNFVQNKMLGIALLKSRRILDGDCMISVVTRNNMEDNGAGPQDMDGIIDQMRNTDGIECAVLLYEGKEGEFKASLRSNHWLDVSAIAQSYGGGGHIRAAGCTLRGDADTVTAVITNAVAEAIKKDKPNV